MTSDHVRRVSRALAGQRVARQTRTLSHLASVPVSETRAILEDLESRGKARRNPQGCWEAT